MDKPLAGEVGVVCAMHYVLRVVVVRKGSTPPFIANFSCSSTRESVLRVNATDTLLSVRSTQKKAGSDYAEIASANEYRYLVKQRVKHFLTYASL